MKRAAIALVRAYRLLVSPLLPEGTCKFHPSCSQYAIDALRVHGLLRGAALAGWRLLRCHPWSAGGVDRIDDQTLFRARGRASEGRGA